MQQQADERTSVRRAIFAGTRCNDISYSIAIDIEDLKRAEFEKAANCKLIERGRNRTTCAPKFPETDYHLHVNWQLQDKLLVTRVEFHEGRIPPAADEYEPWAETFLTWMAAFVPPKSYVTNVQADFEFPSAEFQPRFPLPLKAAIGPDGSEAEIDGLTFGLPSKPSGVHNIWITLVGSILLVHMAGSKQADLHALDVAKDIATYASIAESILEKRKP